MRFPVHLRPHHCHCLGLDTPHPSLEPPAKLLVGVGGLNLSPLQAMICKTKTKEPKMKFLASQRKLYQFPMACSSIWLTRSSSTSSTFHLPSCLLAPSPVYHMQSVSQQLWPSHRPFPLHAPRVLPLHQPVLLHVPTYLLCLQNFPPFKAHSNAIFTVKPTFTPLDNQHCSVAPSVHCALTVMSYKWLVTSLSLPTSQKQGILTAKIYWLPTINQFLFQAFCIYYHL